MVLEWCPLYFQCPLVDRLIGRWIVDGRSYVVDGRCYVVDGRSYVVEGRSYVVDGRSYVVDGRSYVVEGRSYVVEGAPLQDEASHYQLRLSISVNPSITVYVEDYLYNFE